MAIEHNDSWYESGAGGSSSRADQQEDIAELADWGEPSYKDCILFCIDGCDEMYQVNPKTGHSYMHQAIDGAFKVMNKKLISSPRDMVGIIIFGTGHTKQPDALRGRFHADCYMLLDIKQVGVLSRMLLKETLLKSAHDPQYLSKLFGKRKRANYSIPQAIQNCQYIMKAAGKAGTKRVFWITNRDEPHESKTVEYLNRSLVALKEAKRIGIEFDPFLISRSEENRFDINKFYAEIFNQYDDEIPDTTLDAVDERRKRLRPTWDWEVAAEDFDSELLTRETPKRTTFSVRFELGPDWFIGVKGYSTIQPAKKDAAIWFYKDEFAETVQAISKPFYEDSNTGKRLASDERVKAFSFGETATQRSKVELTPEEMTEAKTLGISPGMKLIGMVDSGWLQPEDNISHASFIRPTDQELVGSQCAFAAMLKYMLRKDKIAIAMLVPRAGVSPYLVALLPQDEVVDEEEDVQIVAPGMHLIRLPFADDIREDPIDGRLLDADSKSMDAFKDVIMRCTGKRPYHPDHYPNPELDLHYTILQRVAYNEGEDEIPTPKDHTLPKTKPIVERAGAFIEAFKHSIRENPEAKVDSSKDGGIAPGDIDGEDIKRRWREGELHKLLVSDLKLVCTKLGIAVSGKKADLVIRVHNKLIESFPQDAQARGLKRKEVDE